jgi:hypothetical protein
MKKLLDNEVNLDSYTRNAIITVKAAHEPSTGSQKSHKVDVAANKLASGKLIALNDSVQQNLLKNKKEYERIISLKEEAKNHKEKELESTSAKLVMETKFRDEMISSLKSNEEWINRLETQKSKIEEELAIAVEDLRKEKEKQEKELSDNNNPIIDQQYTAKELEKVAQLLKRQSKR